MERVPIKKLLNEVILKSAERYKNLVVLSADYVQTLGLDEYALTHKDRHFNFGLAENNMMSAAMGFIVRGKNPLVVGLASSLMKAWQTIKDGVCFSNLNVKIIGTHAGLSAGEDGAGFQSLEDIALMRVLPFVKIVSPADYFEAVQVFEKVFLDYGPVYIRLPRTDLPILFDQKVKFEFKKSKVLREGEDVCIFATGAMVENCIKAANLLAEEDVKATVVNVSSIKPLDKKTILKCSKKVKFCVTVEDHSVTGGMGSAIASYLAMANPMKVIRLGVKGSFGESGEVDALYRKHGLDAGGICERVKDCMRS